MITTLRSGSFPNDSSLPYTDISPSLRQRQTFQTMECSGFSLVSVSLSLVGPESFNAFDGYGVLILMN